MNSKVPSNKGHDDSKIEDEFSFDFLLDEQDTKASLLNRNPSSSTTQQQIHSSSRSNLQAAGAKSFEASSGNALNSGDSSSNKDRTDMEDYVASLLGDDFLA